MIYRVSTDLKIHGIYRVRESQYVLLVVSEYDNSFEMLT